MAKGGWQMRVVRMDVVPAGDLLRNDLNWRGHPPAQRAALRTMLAEVGMVQGVMVNMRDLPSWKKQRGKPVLVDGALRHELAMERGRDTPLAVAYVNLTPEEERRVLLTFDPIGAMAQADREKLERLRERSAAEWPKTDLDLTAVLQAGRARKAVAFEAAQATNVLVTCPDGAAQRRLMERLRAEGYTCKATARA